MDELRNMLRQSFNLPAQPVGVVDEKEKLSTANFGNMAEPIFAVCVASFILTKDGSVNTSTVTDILTKSLDQDEKEGVYDLTGDKSLFNFDAQKNIHSKSDELRNQKAEQKHRLDRISQEVARRIDKGNNYDGAISFDGSDAEPLRKYVISVDGEQFYVLAFVAPSKGLRLYDHNVVPRSELIKLFTKKISSFPGMIGNEDGSPIKVEIGSSPRIIGFKYKKVEDDSELASFKSFKENEVPHEELDIPKLIVSVNYNVIPTIQRILNDPDKYEEKHAELIGMIDNIAQYLISGENQVTKARNAYWENKKANLPSQLSIKLMGREGQTVDGRGIIKGDLMISMIDKNGKGIHVPMSLKYGSDVVHTFSSADTLANSVYDAIGIADLYGANIVKSEWELAIATYDDVETLIGLAERTPMGLYGILQKMAKGNQTKMMFAFLERYAHGADESSILHIEKKGSNIHSVPTMISHYLYYQNKYVEVDGGSYIHMRIRDKGGVYGILKIKDKVIMDGELNSFIDKVKKVFTQPRTDMWNLIIYRKYLMRIAAKYETSKELLKTYRNKVDDYARDAEEISKKFKSQKLPNQVALLDNIDSNDFKTSDIMKFMNNDIDTLPENEINSYITIMSSHIRQLYPIIKEFRVIDNTV
jgi:hypothetical protein